MSLKTTTNFRVDIQALRGLAVLWVVFYHAKLLPIKSGYLGVDIFFVISGFLITSQIAQQVKSNTFSFKSFYYRRARRLLPAAYCVFLVCLVLSPWLLSSLEMVDFSKQLLGALTFSGNIVLWLQTGYFEQAAELKPLLHTWSLAIEEQYYLFLPLVLVFINRRYWLLVMAILLLLSLALYIHYQPSKPGATFYLFPTRAWELGIGSLLALSSLKLPNKQIFSHCLALIGWLMLILVPLIAMPTHIPAVMNILAVCFATALVIYAQAPSWENNFLIKILAHFGTISYSLYLVHWPIVSFLHNTHVGGGGLWWPFRLGAVLVSFVLAYILYIWVEQRFRLNKHQQVERKRSISVMLILSFILALLACLTFWLGSHNQQNSHRLMSNAGLSFNCKNLNFASLPECRNDNDPEILIWGDSYAMHWVSGIAATPNAKIIQATRSTCAPVIGLALFSPPKYGDIWAKGCIAFNQAVLDELEKQHSIQTVILGGQWSYLLNSAVIENDNSSLTEKLVSTIEAIRSLGKKVVLMAPPPSVGFDIGNCIERKNTGKFMYGAPEQCQIPVSQFETRAADLSDFLQQVSELGGVHIYSLQDKLCNREYCLTEIGDVALYRDVGHLSHEGSIFIAKKYQLIKQLKQLAR